LDGAEHAGKRRGSWILVGARACESAIGAENEAVVPYSLSASSAAGVSTRIVTTMHADLNAAEHEARKTIEALQPVFVVQPKAIRWWDKNA
jgi:hypothetical protein